MGRPLSQAPCGNHSYRHHHHHVLGLISSVVDAIQELGVEVEHIPGGCTCLCQPVDVGINKPFKKHIRDLWQTWMMGTCLKEQPQLL